MTLPTHEETATWTDAEYFAFEAVNASSLKELVKSPKQYVHRKAHPKPKTLNMVLGSAIHCMTFEAVHFPSRYAVWEGESRRTKAYREWKERQAMAGREVITESEQETARAVAEAASRHPLLLDLLGHPGTQVERAIVWEGKFGPCKAKLDLLHYSPEHGLVIVDLKTTSGELDEHTLTHTMGRYLVHLQLWHYFHAACALYDLEPDNVFGARLIALYAETSAPHDVVACELGPETVEDCKTLYYDLASVYNDCEELGHWPGYQRERLIEVPAYYTQLK